MRWNEKPYVPPEPYKYKWKFLWWPMKIQKETRWLEWSFVEYKFNSMCWKYFPYYFIDNPEEIKQRLRNKD
mgnify:CR=1 FL=1